MKLDPRIICKPFTVFDTDNAKNYIGQPCYYAEGTPGVFRDLDVYNVPVRVLSKVIDTEDCARPFVFEYTEYDEIFEIRADYCLPVINIQGSVIE